MTSTTDELRSRLSWKGDLFAGFVRTNNRTAKLTATADRLSLTGPLGLEYVVEAHRVDELRVARGKFLFWSWDMKNTVAIVHRDDRVSSRLAFRSKNTPVSVMLEGLASLGYPVTR